MGTFRCLAAGICFAVAFLTPASGQPTPYTCSFVQYGVWTAFAGVNNHGDTVGVWGDAGGKAHTFLRKADGTVREITSPTGQQFNPLGINNMGQIFGEWFILNPDGTYITIDPPVAPPGSGSIYIFSGMTGFNDKGEVGGVIADANGPIYGFEIWGFIRTADGKYNLVYENGTDVDFTSFTTGPINNSDSIVVFDRYTDGYIYLADGTVPNNGTAIYIDYPSPCCGGYPGLNGIVPTAAMNNNNATVGSVSGNVDYGGPWAGQVFSPNGGGWQLTCPEYPLATSGNYGMGGINDYNEIVGTVANVGFIAMPTGPLPSVTVGNSDWKFSAHIVGEASGNGTVYLTNHGHVDLHVPTLWVGKSGKMSDQPSSFKVVETNCSNPANLITPNAIHPGNSCFVKFNFVPQVGGWQTAAIYVSNDSTNNSPVKIEVGGTGVDTDLSTSNSTWDFGNQMVGTISTAATVSLSNRGPATVLLDSIHLSDPGPGKNFNLLGNTCGTSLAAKATCKLTFDFTPESTGLHTALLNLNLKAKHAVQIPLSGHGVN